MPQFFGPTLSDALEGAELPEALRAPQLAVLRAPVIHRVDDVLAWMASCLVWELGFDRAMALRATGNHLTIAATASRSPGQAARAHRVAVRHPVELRAGSLESEMLHRRAPSLVVPAADTGGAAIVTRLRTGPYVAAPVEAFGRPAATVHANTCSSGGRAGFGERATIGAFAVLCSGLIERAQLFEELAGRQPPAVLPVRAASTSDPPPDPARLSPREHEVLDLMAAGATSRQIAAELVVSVGTVRTHAENIRRKLGARTRAEAVAKAGWPRNP